MKNRLFLFIAMLGISTCAIAQQLVAVLTHEGTSKSFNGYHALQEAYEEATHGDLITLSSGSFGAVTTIEKAIKIRGAGMEADTLYHTGPTTIVGDMTLAIPNDGTNHFCLEGIFHDNTIYYSKNLVKPEFVKCRLSDINRATYTEQGNTYYGRIQDALFYHCKIKSQLVCGFESSITAINSVIFMPYCINDTTSIFSLNYCILEWGGSYGASIRLYSSSVNNCIINNNSVAYNKYTTFNNCLLPSGLKPDVSMHSYYNFESLSNVYKTYKSRGYSDKETFELWDDIKDVGIYSGPFPYSPRVVGPHIQKMEVAPQTTEAGTLNVRIKVQNITK